MCAERKGAVNVFMIIRHNMKCLPEILGKMSCSTYINT